MQSFKCTSAFFWLFVFVFFPLKASDELLEKLPIINVPQMNQVDPSGHYRSAFFVPLSYPQVFSSDPLVQSLWNLSVGTLGKKLDKDKSIYFPDLAASIKKEELEGHLLYDVYLHPNLVWQPLDQNLVSKKQLTSFFKEKKTVTAEDFEFFFKVLKNSHLTSSESILLKKKYAFIQEFKILSEHHFQILCSKDLATQSDEDVLQLRPLPKAFWMKDEKGNDLLTHLDIESLDFAKAFESHWLTPCIPCCGAWKIIHQSQEKIELIKNEDYPYKDQIPLKHLSFYKKKDPNSAWQAFKQLEIDSHYLTPFQLKDYAAFLNSKIYQRQKKQHQVIKEVYLDTHLYYFIGWNQRRPLFKDPKIRQALSACILVDELIERFLGQMAVPIKSPLFSLEQKPDSFALSAEEIQTRLKKQQKPLSFSLLYYRHNPLAHLLCEFIKNQYQQRGIDCHLEGVNYENFCQRLEKKEFDAVFLAWSYEDLLGHLTQVFASTSSSNPDNLIGYYSEPMNQWIDELKKANGDREKKEILKEIEKRIIIDQPYTFLYRSKQLLLVRENLNHVCWKENKKTKASSLYPEGFYFEVNK